MPYFKSKLHSIYNKEREAILQASLWGEADTALDDAAYFQVGGEFSQPPREGSDSEPSRVARFRKRIKEIIGVCYPWIHATNEGISLN